MSNFEMPENINPYQLADKQAGLEGVVPALRLNRLSQAVVSIDKPAEAQLSFKRDDSGRRVIEGKVFCAVSLECQRCMEPYPVELSGEFTLAIVYNDEMARALPAGLDSLLHLPDEQLDVASIIEDELLLCLPMHAMHPEGDCKIETQFGLDEVEDAPSKPNPFDVLKDLK